MTRLPKSLRRCDCNSKLHLIAIGAKLSWTHTICSRMASQWEKLQLTTNTTKVNCPHNWTTGTSQRKLWYLERSYQYRIPVDYSRTKSHLKVKLSKERTTSWKTKRCRWVSFHKEITFWRVYRRSWNLETGLMVSYCQKLSLSKVFNEEQTLNMNYI